MQTLKSAAVVFCTAKKAAEAMAAYKGILKLKEM